MKKKFFIAVAIAAALSLAACSSSAESSTAESASTADAAGSSQESSSAGSETLQSGEWTVNTEYEIAAMPEDADLAYGAAYESYEGALIDPIAYLGSQVVSGMNYAYLCVSEADGVRSLAAVVVYENLEGTAEITGVTPFELSDYAGKDSEAKLAGEQLSGGWTAAEDLQAVSLPEAVQKSFDTATAGNEAQYVPLAYLGNRGDTDYAVLCMKKAGEVKSFTVLTISGNKIANDAGFDIADVIS